MIGKEKINENGFNYLQDLRIITMKTKNNSTSLKLNNSLTSPIENEPTPAYTEIPENQQVHSTVVDLLTTQVDELKKQLNDQKAETLKWQELYLGKEKYINEKILPQLLNTSEGNQQTEEKMKKGFFGFFKK